MAFAAPSPLVRRLALVALAAIAALSALAGAPGRAPAAQAQTAPVAPITLNGLRNATYPAPAVAGGTATLHDGAFAGPGSDGAPVSVTFVTNAVAPAFAAVVLETRTRGGAAATLYLVTAPGGALTASAGTPLGDGVAAQSVAIVGDRVTVALREPAPGDPPGDPSRAVTRTFMRVAGGFATAADSIGAAGGVVAAAPAPSTTGSGGALHTAATPGFAVELALLALTIGGVALARWAVSAQ